MIARITQWMERRRRAATRAKEDAEFAQLNARKAAGQRTQGTDFARAQIFLGRKQTVGAIEALKEELRYFPGHTEAATQLKALLDAQPAPEIGGNAEFQELFAAIKPYTMVGSARLLSLYQLALDVCERDLPGNFVECGVAAGGSSALVAAVIKRHSKRPRRLFACDTFEGMPDSGAEDVAFGVQAGASGWGKGTCAAPVDSLREICAKLDVTEIVEPLQGLFADTLPVHRERIGAIGFLHMDGDWYSSTRDILVHLFDQVVPGAAIQIDDYGYWDGCRRALADFERERAIKFELRKIDETGVWTTK